MLLGRGEEHLWGDETWLSRWQLFTRPGGPLAQSGHKRELQEGPPHDDKHSDACREKALKIGQNLILSYWYTSVNSWENKKHAGKKICFCYILYSYSMKNIILSTRYTTSNYNMTKLEKWMDGQEGSVFMASEE